MQNTVAVPSVLDYALNYATEFKWAVFPCHSIAADGLCTCGSSTCKSEGKHPRTAKGSLDASKDTAELTAWFAGAVDTHNIGIATGAISDLVVVDVDLGKGADLQDLLIDGLTTAVFDTPNVKTGAGLHFYYRLPAGVTVKNSASRLGKFIDVRGDGGYVIAPPSKHLSGSNYELLNPHSDQILELPKQWLDKLTQPSPSTNGNGASANGSNPFVVPASQPGIILPDSINQGQRNVELTKIAGALRSKGLSEGAIYAALHVENLRICQPPLDDKELHQIARSVGRYKPHDVLNQVSDVDPNDPAFDYENTLTAYTLGGFLDATFADLEVLAFHISKTEIGIIQAPTNAGKTTILRNVALAMACGRPFHPFYDGHRPIKIAYFDFESSAQRAQPDMAKMFTALTPVEKAVARDNLILIPKGMRNGELFQFNTGEDWVHALLTQNAVEFVIVDNISAAYDLNDENSNAEINRKVIKPLLKLAYKGDCAFLFAHHYGKGKGNEIEQAGVHAGRGASNLQSLSQTVINMFGNVSKGEPIIFECAKRKTDGGQNYREAFELKDDRWFHPSLIVPPPKARSCAETLNEYINDKVTFPDTITPADLLDIFDGVFGIDMINKSLNVLATNGFISKQNRGEYCGRKSKKKDPDKIKNFYETDADED